MNKKYMTLLQRRIANLAVGPSTARGMGPKGTIRAAREYLAKVQLARFVTSSRRSFESCLDRSTRELVACVPPGGQHWGSARKFLNIFLRDCAYQRHVCSLYRMDQIEAWLELPLDSHVAKGLKRDRHFGGEVSRWTTVIGLTPERSSAYQATAAKIATKERVHRVHLDIKYWRNTA